MYQFAKTTSYIIYDHHRLDDMRVAKQDHAIDPLFPKAFVRFYETFGGKRNPQEDLSRK